MYNYYVKYNEDTIVCETLSDAIEAMTEKLEKLPESQLKEMAEDLHSAEITVVMHGEELTCWSLHENYEYLSSRRISPENTNIWFALQKASDDGWDGPGSYDINEAVMLAQKDAFPIIAVLDAGGDPFCLDELRAGEDYNEKVTRTWRVYGQAGHRQRESFFPSYCYDFSSARQGIRILDVQNSDITGTNDFTVVTITRSSAQECEEELEGQISDGIFEDSRVGYVEEVESTKDIHKRKSKGR